MPYCENCGTQISATAKFCGNCGAQRNPTQTTTEPTKPTQPTKPAAQPKSRIEYYSPPNMAWIPQAPYPTIGQQSANPQFSQAPPVMQPTAPMQPIPGSTAPQVMPTPQAQTGEATLGVILFRRNKSLGRYDSYAGVLTTQRMIFAQLTAEMLNKAAQQARDQAKAEGKGFFGAWGDQLKATFGYIKKYQNIPPDAIIAETPGNFALYNSTINEVKVHLKGQHDNDGPREFEAEIKTTSGTFKYRMNEDRYNTDLLKRVYGERVKMPFGYLGSVKVKF